jgi:hypothetical protein
MTCAALCPQASTMNNAPVMDNALQWNQQAPMMLLRGVRITACLWS